MAKEKNALLLNLVGTAVDANGVWTYVGNLAAPFTVHVHGVPGVGDAVVINGSCRIPGPTAAEHDVQIASVVIDGFVTISGPLAWIKARKAAATVSSSVRVQGFVP